MKRIITCMIFMVLVFAMSVFAAGDITYITPSLVYTGNVSETIPASFIINNTGDAAVRVEFTDYNFSTGSYSITGNINAITLQSNESKNVTFNIALGSKQFAGSYSGKITATAKDLITLGQVDQENLTVSITVNPHDALSTTSVSANIVAGIAHELSFQITNGGNRDSIGTIIDLNDLTKSGSRITKDTMTFSSSTLLNIAYDNTEISNFTITVPGNQSVGTYTGNFYVSNTNGVNVSVPLTITVAQQSSSVSFSDASITITKGIETSDNVDVEVTNNGNINLSTVSMEVSDLTYGTETIASTYVSVSPTAVSDLGQSASTTFNVAVSLPQSNQTSGTYTGQLNVTYDGNVTTHTLSVVVEEAISDIEIGDVSIGGSNILRNRSYTSDVTIKNTGDYTISQITGTLNGNDAYNLSYSGLPSVLTPGQEATFQVSGFVPSQETGGDHEVGTLSITSDRVNKTISLRMAPESMLEITDVKIYVNGDKETVSDNEVVDNIDPGDSIEVRVEVKNNFDRDSDIEIDNIVIDLVVEGFEDEGDDDLELDTSDFTLKEDKDTTKTFSFEVPYKIEEGNYNVVITAEGDDDEYDGTHSDTFEFEIEIEKPTNDVRFQKAEMRNTVLSCDRTSYLDIDVYNFGTEDQDEVVLTIYSNDLDFDVREFFELTADPFDSDSEFIKSYYVNANNLKTGTYPITIKLYRDTDNLEDTKTINVQVRDCEDVTPPPTDDGNDDIVINPGTQNPTTPPVIVPPTSSDDQQYTRPASSYLSESFFDSNLYIVLLVLAIVASVIIIFVMLIRLLR
ncbi:hypothetical protein K9M79_00305 [Candidatus Woesearchaeota archaeon]|nr:hypothetical protein [Candidatus Woesearchaeota archaeon]